MIYMTGAINFAYSNSSTNCCKYEQVCNCKFKTNSIPYSFKGEPSLYVDQSESRVLRFGLTFKMTIPLNSSLTKACMLGDSGFF